MSETSLQNQILNTTAEMHSAQDGITFGILTALAITGSPLLTVLAIAFGFAGQKATNKMLLLRASTDMLRVDEIRSNPEYFAITWTVTTVAITAFIHFAGIYLPIAI